MSALVSVEDHLADILAAVTPIDAETVPLADAHGRTLREPVRAAVDLPVFDNSAMDGFAVRYADVESASADAPVRLRVTADLPAGTADDPRIAHGTAARIMTGAPIPADADAVVPFEDTAGGLADSLGEITVLAPPGAIGAHIRRAGEDVRRGDTVLAPGTLLGALQLAAAAAAGATEMVVSRPPRVVVVSTGTELAAPGAPLERGQIPESNGTLLHALVEEAGAVVGRRAIVSDEQGALGSLLDELAASGERFDAVILSGGVSAGAYEPVRQTLADVMTFRKVAMQPGKPQGFGRLAGGALAFGLPGNPVSVAVSFETFVRPALLAMQGRTTVQRERIALPTTAGWRTPPGRRQYLPVALNRTDPRGWRVAPASSGGSHLAARLGQAEAYAIIPAEVEAVDAGDIVDVMLIS